MRIRAIYDNGGRTVDRFSVYYTKEREGKYYPGLFMSAEPFHPMGIGEHGDGMLGPHNGKRITFQELPPDCQRAVKNGIGE